MSDKDIEERLTWDMIKAQYEYWESNPPVNESFARFIGIKFKKKEDSKYGDLADLLSLFPGGGINLDPKLVSAPSTK